MSKRGHISLEIQLAAALLQIPGCGITHEEAKTLTAKQIRSRFELDHWPIPAAEGGAGVPWNLTWRPKAEHREKTHKLDIAAIAKGKRIRRKHALHIGRLSPAAVENAQQLLAAVRTARKRKWPSRPFPKRAK